MIRSEKPTPHTYAELRELGLDERAFPEAPFQDPIQLESEYINPLSENFREYELGRFKKMLAQGINSRKPHYETISVDELYYSIGVPEIVSVRELGNWVRQSKHALIIISDVHAKPGLLKRAKNELELFDKDNQKQASFEIYQIGDLVDQYNSLNEATIKEATFLDGVVCGNHEVAILLRRWPDNTVRYSNDTFLNVMLALSESRNRIEVDVERLEHDRELLLDRCRDKFIRPIIVREIGGQKIVLTHGGLNVSLFPEHAHSIDDVEKYLNKSWERFIDAPSMTTAKGHMRNALSKNQLLFGVGSRRIRGGYGDENGGGVLWQDYRDAKRSDSPADILQFVGHTELSCLEETLHPSSKIYGIDLVGYQLGIAAINDAGEVKFASI